MKIIKKDIQEYALSIGIADLGFCDAKPNIGYANFIKERATDKKTYLDVDYTTIDQDTYDPSFHLKDAKTVIVILYPYHMDFKSETSLPQGHVRLSKASIFKDYHSKVLSQCRQIEEYIGQTYNAKTTSYCDTGPLNDKAILLKTGMVKIGRSSLLIHPKFGTRFYIGYIITDLDMGIESYPINTQEDYEAYFHPFCAKCGRCANSCPNKAIQTFGQLTSKRCISFLTQSKEWENTLVEINPSLSLDGYVYGCDTCQRVCPLNGISLHMYCQENLVESHQSMDELLGLSNRQFKEKFGATSAGWIGNKRFKRNILQIQEERKED